MTLTQRRNIGIGAAVVAALLIISWKSTAQTRGGGLAPRPTTGSGPYKAVMEMDAGLPDHTIYRPENLAGLNGANVPVVIWGNGACANSGNAFRNFLTDI